MEPVPLAETRCEQRIEVLRTLRYLGEATALKIGQVNPAINNAHARCAELLAAWLIETTGGYAFNPTGRSARLLRLTESGKLAVEDEPPFKPNCICENLAGDCDAIHLRSGIGWPS